MTPGRRTIASSAALCFALTVLSGFPAPAIAQDEPLTIRRVTPLGNDVPPGNQIVIEFNRPVVPLGRMERDAAELPITIRPSLDCQWRWVNRQALACNLDDSNRMAEATRYTVTIAPGITAMDGSTTADAVTQTFITRRPAIINNWFRTWRHPGVPVLRLTFNQPVSKSSVEASLFLSVTDSEAVAVADAAVVTAVVAAPDPDDRELPRFIGIPGEKLVLDAGPQSSQPPDEQPTITADGEEARRIWLIEPAAELPLDTTVILSQRPGLISALGPEPGIARDGVIQFQTFPSFDFLGIRCHNNSGETILIGADETTPTEPARLCNPLASIGLSFSAPVLGSEIAREVVLDPDLGGGREDYDPWANRRDRSYLRSPHTKDRTYDIWLPERLRAYQRYSVTSREPERGLLDTLRAAIGDLPDTAIRDEFGRPLEQAIAIDFWTNHRIPDFDLIHHDAVLESAIDSEVPLYVTNLDQVQASYRRLTADGALAGQQHTFNPPAAEDIAFAVPLGVREMTEGQTGAVYGTLSSNPAARRSSWERRFFAQVTPYQVHAKVGHFNTLVWVTDLETGEPVANATVSLYRDKLTELGIPPTDAVTERTNEEGIAMLPGTVSADPTLATFGWRCNADDCEKLFVRVDADKGLALLPLNRHYRVNVYRASNYRVYPNLQQKYGHIHTWGTTAQGVYRAGDTIEFKIYVRDQSNDRFVPAPRETYTLALTDPGGKTVHEIKDITLSEFGAIEGSYRAPETSVMGWYGFRLKASFTDHEWRPMRVLVSDFTPAAFRVANEINGDLFQPGDTLTTDTTAMLHSGGPYTQAEARITLNLQAGWFRSSHPTARSFRFDTSNRVTRIQLHQEIGELTEAGSHVSSVELAEDRIVYGRLTAESAVRDDRGKYIAATAAADYIAIDRLVGLRKDRWVFDEDEAAEIEFITVDQRGEPVADTDVQITIERKVTKAARVKGAGNAYVTSFSESWEGVGSCAARPANGPETCRFTPPDPGQYRIVATITDTRGRSHTTNLWAWVAGKGQVVWRDDATNALEMIPEKETFDVGDTARLLIKNPYPGATALVTLERYGVLRQWQTTLEGSTPVLEFPIEGELVPGAYLSVLVFSPRVADPPEANSDGGAELDLGKPAFRLGYLEIPVVDPYKRIEVEAATDRDLYKPGDTVQANLTAVAASPGAEKAPIEYAVAVLDEAVFDLIAGGRDYFDPYKGFYSLDGLDVDNYNLLLRIVGRQKFEKKGASSGGDGGEGLTMRSIFKYVAFWDPSLEADDDGKARFEFELPDNLTGWRVLALAATPDDRFGLGDVTFKTNQPTEIRPVMPNQVTEGDGFQAGFSVMNRTDTARTLNVTVRGRGDVDGGGVEMTTTVELEPYERKTVSMPLVAGRLKSSRDVERGNITFEARAWDAADGDALTHPIPVLKYRHFEVAASYGSITEGSAVEPIAFPADIHTDVGSVSVVLSPTVIGNAEGAFRYIRDYDYVCWEQVLTRGVMASHFNGLEAYLDPTLEWPESTTLPAEMLQRAANYQAPNGGMTYFVPNDRNVSPYLSAYTALAFNWLRAAGHEIPTQVEARLHAYLANLLRRDDVPTFYTRGMSSTVRAVALNALAAHDKLTLTDLERYEPHVQYMDLFGAANFMDAAMQIDGSGDVLGTALNRVLAHSSTTGGKLTFNEEVDDSYSRILTTQLRSNCAVLSALSRVPDLSANGLTDMPPAMVRAITQTRGNRDHWENTQENMFCMNALIDYSRRWEAVPPDMRVTATLDGKGIGAGAFTDLRDPAFEFSTPITPAHPGSDAQIVISREGDGRLYYAARASYAPTADNPERINAGIDVRREYSVLRDGDWQLLGDPAVVTRGELVRVDLYVDLPTARNFVVVDDHVPGGLEPVNRALANTSGVDADAGDFAAAGGSWWLQFSDWISYAVSRWSFYHREIRHDAVRFYSDYLPPGRYHLTYSAQAIAPGRYSIRPGQAAEMYDPDVYGKTRPAVLTVRDSP